MAAQVVDDAALPHLADRHLDMCLGALTEKIGNRAALNTEAVGIQKALPHMTEDMH